MNRRLRSAGITAGLGLAAAGALFHPVPAHADDVATVSVTWQVNSGSFGDRFGVPQTYPALKCGLHQVDVYRYGTPEERATVDALLAKGTLSSAAEDGSVWISNTDEDLGPCQTSTPTPVPTETAPVTPPATSSPTPSSTPSPTPTQSSTPSPTSTPRPTRTPSPTSLPSASSTATATEAATPPSSGTARTAAKTGELAFTGSEYVGAFAALAAGLLAGGAALIRINRRRRNS